MKSRRRRGWCGSGVEIREGYWPSMAANQVSRKRRSRFENLEGKSVILSVEKSECYEIEHKECSTPQRPRESQCSGRKLAVQPWRKEEEHIQGGRLSGFLTVATS